jgi:hypothetical protein
MLVLPVPIHIIPHWTKRRNWNGKYCLQFVHNIGIVNSKYCVHMCINGKMRPVETILGRRRGNTGK